MGALLCPGRNLGHTVAHSSVSRRKCATLTMRALDLHIECAGTAWVPRHSWSMCEEGSAVHQDLLALEILSLATQPRMPRSEMTQSTEAVGAAGAREYRPVPHSSPMETVLHGSPRNSKASAVSPWDPAGKGLSPEFRYVFCWVQQPPGRPTRHPDALRRLGSAEMPPARGERQNDRPLDPGILLVGSRLRDLHN